LVKLQTTKTTPANRYYLVRFGSAVISGWNIIAFRSVASVEISGMTLESDDESSVWLTAEC
jgi:hypothetical protein